MHVAQITQSATLKSRVKEHWEREACGERYGDETDRKIFFETISKTRYRLEPYIPHFADFPSAGGKTVLEIGVGAGADFQNWCSHALHATGVDLTEKAIALTRERLQINSISPERFSLRTADAEALPFSSDSFDLVYSWGVLHHTPDTPKAFREVLRVMKPGGAMKAMIYHAPSWGGLMLYLSWGLARGRLRMTLKEAIFCNLESPGTKAYSLKEAQVLLKDAGFDHIQTGLRLSPGDLLTVKPSEKYSSPIFKLIWRVYPRWLVRLFGERYGLSLLIEAKKPA